jgi:hypothetical protein
MRAEVLGADVIILKFGLFGSDKDDTACTHEVLPFDGGLR